MIDIDAIREHYLFWGDSRSRPPALRALAALCDEVERLREEAARFTHREAWERLNNANARLREENQELRYPEFKPPAVENDENVGRADQAVVDEEMP